MADVPVDAPEHCPGVQSEEAGKAGPCAGCPNQTICSSGEARRVDPDVELIADRLAKVKSKVLVLSGKGGVGKSTVTSNLARVLAQDKNRMIGVLDVDICGPSQPRMLGRETETVHESASGWEPVFVEDNLMMMSIGFLLQGRGEAVIWRGARKNALIKQFLRDVDWGALDVLLIDTPPGTSDEHISIVQMLLQAGPLDGALIVTTPQEVALLDVRKEINFCHKTKVPVLGVIENMSSFVCLHCSKCSDLFPATTGGAMEMCRELNLPLLARLPHDARMSAVLDDGKDFFEQYSDSPLAIAFVQLAQDIIKRLQSL